VTARRFPFRLEIAGVTVAGVIETEDELDEQLAGRDQVAEQTPLLPIERVAEPHRGRPSFDRIVAAAIDALGAKLRRKGPAAGARMVLHHMAQTCDDPDLLPKRRTVEAFLAARKPTRRKERRKERKKSPRGIRQGGGSHARSKYAVAQVKRQLR
jgi:hypothetical protein